MPQARLAVLAVVLMAAAALASGGQAYAHPNPEGSNVDEAADHIGHLFIDTNDRRMNAVFMIMMHKAGTYSYEPTTYNLDNHPRGYDPAIHDGTFDWPPESGRVEYVDYTGRTPYTRNGNPSSEFGLLIKEGDRDVLFTSSDRSGRDYQGTVYVETTTDADMVLTVVFKQAGTYTVRIGDVGDGILAEYEVNSTGTGYAHRKFLRNLDVDADSQVYISGSTPPRFLYNYVEFEPINRDSAVATVDSIDVTESTASISITSNTNGTIQSRLKHVRQYAGVDNTYTYTSGYDDAGTIRNFALDVQAGRTYTMNFTGLEPDSIYRIEFADRFLARTVVIGTAAELFETAPRQTIPLTLGTVPDGMISEGGVITNRIPYSNPEGHNITWSIVSGPEGATVDDTGRFTWKSGEEHGRDEPYEFVIQASAYIDRPRVTFWVTVRDINEAPRLSSPREHTALAGIPLVLQLEGEDPDLPKQTLSYSLVGNTRGATISGDILTWEPTADDIGDRTLRVKVQDDHEQPRSDIAVLKIHVKTPTPPDAPDEPYTTPEEVVLHMRPGVTDADHTAVITAVTGGLLGEVTFNGTVITYKPHADLYGQEILNYTVTDIDGLQDTGMLTVTVTSVHDAPMPLLTDRIIRRGGHLTFLVPVDAPDSETLNFSVAPLAPGAEGARMHGDRFVWTPGPDTALSPHIFNVTADDGQASASGTFTVWVVAGSGQIDGINPYYANDDYIEMVANVPNIISNDDLLANDVYWNGPDEILFGGKGNVTIQEAGGVDVTVLEIMDGISTVLEIIEGNATIRQTSDGDFTVLEITKGNVTVQEIIKGNVTVRQLGQGNYVVTPDRGFAGITTFTYGGHVSGYPFRATVIVNVTGIDAVPGDAGNGTVTMPVPDINGNMTVIPQAPNGTGNGTVIKPLPDAGGNVTVIKPMPNGTGNGTTAMPVPDGAGNNTNPESGTNMTASTPAPDDDSNMTASTPAPDDDSNMTSNEPVPGGNGNMTVIPQAPNGTGNGTTAMPVPDGAGNNTNPESGTNMTASTPLGALDVASEAYAQTVDAIDIYQLAPAVLDDTITFDVDRPGATIPPGSTVEIGHVYAVYDSGSTIYRDDIPLFNPSSFGTTLAPSLNGSGTLSTNTAGTGPNATLSANTTSTSGTLSISSTNTDLSAFEQLFGWITISGTEITYTAGAAPTSADGPHLYRLVMHYTVTDSSGNSDSAAAKLLHSPPFSVIVANDDIDTTVAGVPVVIDVLENDERTNSPTLTLHASLPRPSNGEAFVENSMIRYVPADGFSGTDTITYLVSDTVENAGSSDIARVTVTVLEAPTEVEAATISNVPVLIDMPHDYADPEIDMRVAPTNGTVDTHGGMIRYMPDPDFAGTDTITYLLAGTVGGSDEADIVRATVAVSDDTLMAVDDITASRANSDRTVDVRANDIGAADAAVEIVSVSGPSAGHATVVDNNIVYSRPAVGHGTGVRDTAVIEYRITFGGHADTARLTVEYVSFDPRLYDDRALTIKDRSPDIDVAANDAFVSASSDGLANIQGADHGQVDFLSSRGPIRYLLDAGFAGMDSFTYMAVDPFGNSLPHVSATVDLRVLDLPFMAIDDVAQASVGQPAEISVLANDISAGGATVEIMAGPYDGDASVSGGIITYNYTGNTFGGTDIITYSITDGSSVDYARVFVTIPVNSSLLVNVPPDVSIPEHAEHTFDADLADGATGTFGLVDEPDGATINATTGHFSWTPSEDQGDQTYIFVVTVNDGGSIIGAKFISIMVNEANAAPTITPIADITDAVAGQTISFTITANDTDTSGDFRYLLDSPKDVGAEVGRNTGLFTWTPTEVHMGSTTFNIRVWDGVDNDGNSRERFVITVLGTRDDAETVAEDGSILIDVLANDVAPGGTIEVVANPSNGVAVEEDGQIRYTPVRNYYGTDTFEYAVTVDHGRGPRTYTATVTVDVTQVLDAVTISTVQESNQTNPIGLTEMTANQIPLTITNPDSLSYAVEIGVEAQAQVGMPVFDAENSRLSWTPPDNATGAARVHLNVTTYEHGLDEETPATPVQVGQVQAVTIYFAVMVANELPEIADIDNITRAFTAEPVIVQVSAFDSDEPEQALTYTLEGTVPAGAGIRPDTGLFLWTPDSGQTGTHTITVRVSDGVGHSEKTFDVTVVQRPVEFALPEPPAGQTAISINEHEEYAFDAAVISSAVPYRFAFIPASEFPALANTGAPQGAMITPEGNFTWTPSEEQGGQDYTIEIYMITNSTMPGETSLSLQLRLNVAEKNLNPVVESIPRMEVLAGGTIEFQINATDGDLAPGQTGLNYTLYPNFPRGVNGSADVLDPSTGYFNWTVPLETAQLGLHAFQLGVWDGVAVNSVTYQIFEIEVVPIEVAALNLPGNPYDEPEVGTIRIEIGMDPPVEDPPNLVLANPLGIGAADITWDLVGETHGAEITGPETGSTFAWDIDNTYGRDEPYRFGSVISTGDYSLDYNFTITINDGDPAPPAEVTVLDPIHLGALFEYQPGTGDGHANQSVIYRLYAHHISVSDDSEYAVVDPDTGLVTWVPERLYSESWPVQIVVEATSQDNIDGNLRGDLLYINITSILDSDEITLADTLPEQVAHAGRPFGYAIPLGNNHSQIIAWNITSDDRGAAIDADGSFEWTPDDAHLAGDATHTFDIEAAAATNTATVTLTVRVNDPPEITIGPQTVGEGAVLTVTPDVADTDAGNTTTFALAHGPLPAGSTFGTHTFDTSTGVLVWAPGEDDGGSTINVTITVTDGDSAQDSEEFEIAVIETNQDPVFTTTQTGLEATAEEPFTHDLNATDSDTPEQAVTFAIVSQNPQTNPAVINETTGEITWTPAVAETRTMTVRASDDFVPPGTAEITLNVTVGQAAPNMPPDAPDESISAEAGTPTTFAPMISDHEGTAVITAAGPAQKGDVTHTATEITYTPRADEGGTDSFDYTVADGEGLTATGSINVIITSGTGDFLIDDVPDLEVNAMSTLRHDITTTGTTGDVRYRIDGPAGARIHPVSGHLVYVPHENHSGTTQTLTVRATDETGPVSADINVTVGQPIATIDSVGTTTFGSQQRIEYTAGSQDTLARYQYYSGGTSTTHFGGVFSAAAGSSSGGLTTDSFQSTHPIDGALYYLEIRISTGQYDRNENIYVKFTPGESEYEIIPNPDSRPNPVAPDTIVVAEHDPPVEIEPELVGLDGDTIVITAVTNGSGGRADHTGTAVTYAPDTDSVVTDIVTYTVTDDTAKTGTGMITITIPTGPLQAQNDTAMTVEDAAVNIDVLGNDTAEGATLTVTGQPERGVATKEANNTITYDPADDYNGEDTFEYTIRRGTESQTATVTVTIDPVDDPVSFDVPANDEGQAHISIPELQEYSFDIHVTNPDDIRYALDVDLGDPPATGAELTPAGNFSWTPAEIQGPGEYTIAITLDPEGRGNVTRQFVLSVTEANQDPVFDAVDIPVAVVGAPFRLDLVARDADDPPQTITYDITEQDPPENPAVINSTTGRITWTPAAAQNRTITVQASDDHTPNGTAEITLTVTAEWMMLAARPDTDDTLEDEPVNIDVLANDVADGANLEVSMQPGNGTATKEANNTITYDPHDNFNGRDTFEYTIERDGASQTATVTVDVTAQDDPPTFDVPSDDGGAGFITINELEPYGFDITVANPDEIDYIFDIDAGDPQAAGANITPSGSFSWTPDETAGGGTYTVTITLDPVPEGRENVTQMITFSVAETNQDPVFEAHETDLTEFTNNTLTHDLNAIDADEPPQAITYTITSQNPSDNPAEIDGQTGIITWTPTYAQNRTITVQASDDYTPNGTVQTTLRVVVLDEPPLVEVTATPQGDTVTFLIIPSTADIIIGRILDSNGTAVYDFGQLTPTAIGTPIPVSPVPFDTFVGGATYTYQFARGTDTGYASGDIVEGTFDIPPPETVPIGLGVIEPQTASEGAETDYAIPLVNPDRQPVTWTITSESHGAIITADGRFVWTPGEEHGGDTYGFDFTATADTNAVDGTLSVAVTETNQNPAFDTPTVPPAAVGEPFTLDLNANDDDIPEQAITYAILSQDPSENPADIDEMTGIITWTPATTETRTITVRASDDYAPNGTAEMDITIIVTDVPPANTPPRAQDVTETVTAGKSVTIDLSAGDRIGDDQQDADTLAVSISKSPLQGKANAAGTTITYTANTGAKDTDTILYAVTDDGGLNATAMISITVVPRLTDPGRDSGTVIAPVSDAEIRGMLEAYMSRGLVAFAGIFPISEDGTIPAGAANPVDPDRMHGPAGFLHAGILVDMKDTGLSGGGIAGHTLSDIIGNDGNATMSVFINEIGNVPPALSPVGYYRINAHDTLTFAVSAADFDDTPSYTLSDAPADAKISGEGVFSWTPGSADEGDHTFVIAAHDGQNRSDTRSVTITVLPAETPNKSPAAPDVAATVAPGGMVTIIPAISDPDDDPIRITGATGDAGGTIIPSGNSIEYIAGQILGIETITYTVTDSRGAMSAGAITITIQ